MYRRLCDYNYHSCPSSPYRRPDAILQHATLPLFTSSCVEASRRLYLNRSSSISFCRFMSCLRRYIQDTNQCCREGPRGNVMVGRYGVWRSGALNMLCHEATHGMPHEPQLIGSVLLSPKLHYPVFLLRSSSESLLTL